MEELILACGLIKIIERADSFFFLICCLRTCIIGHKFEVDAAVLNLSPLKILSRKGSFWEEKCKKLYTPSGEAYKDRVTFPTEGQTVDEGPISVLMEYVKPFLVASDKRGLKNEIQTT